MVFGWIEQTGASVEKGRDLAVFPLAVPAIAGPGAITAVILLTDNGVYSVHGRAETAVVLLVVLALLPLTSSVRRDSAYHWPTGGSDSDPGHGDNSNRPFGRLRACRIVDR
jgi:hypothetical protein